MTWLLALVIHGRTSSKASYADYNQRLQTRPEVLTKCDGPLSMICQVGSGITFLQMQATFKVVLGHLCPEVDSQENRIDLLAV